MIRLAAIDVDGTLIDHAPEIDERNIAAVQRAMARGVMVMLATGRMYRSALPFAQMLNMPASNPLIAYNGALTKTLSGDVLDEITLAPDVVIDVLDLAEPQGWTVNLYHDDNLYVGAITKYVRDYEVLAGLPAVLVPSLRSLLHSGKVEIPKLLIIGEPEDTEPRLLRLQQHLGSRAEVVRSRPHFIEITAAAANKGRALARLAEQLGIARAEVLAIGDSGNDVAMLRYAGTGVAVANGSDAAKEAAAFLTGSQAEAGVAEALDRFCG